MKHTPFPARVVPLRRVPPEQSGGAPSRVRINPVSARRARENRQRAAMADRRWPDRRDGTVLCTNPDCPNRAEDLHEIVRRSQLGSIVSDENTIPVCRPCNSALAGAPAWGYRAGLIKHDALCCRGRDVCARYEDTGSAA
jgi:hypothetical protein